MDEEQYEFYKQKLDALLAEAKEIGLPFESACVFVQDAGQIYVVHLQPVKYRNIYSHTKSFTSIMVGIAIDEGKLCLEDHLVDFIGDEMTPEQRENFKDVRLIDLMTMRSGMGGSILMEFDRRKGLCYKDYLAYVLSHPVLHQPGTEFAYSNGDTFLASIMVSRAYGKPFYELCYERIFKPMHCICPTWESDLKGNCVAATALFLGIEDMNKLGIMLLQNGLYGGSRIVSKAYVDLLRNTRVPAKGWGDYSLQIWHNPKGDVLRADGLHGQFTFIDFDRRIALSFQRGEDERADEARALIEKYFFAE